MVVHALNPANLGASLGEEPGSEHEPGAFQGLGSSDDSVVTDVMGPLFYNWRLYVVPFWVVDYNPQ